MPIQIRTPIWCGSLKKRAVGIAEYRMGSGGLDIEITYKRKDGSLIYPHLYHATREQLLKAPLQITRKGGVKLRLIPVEDLTVKEERE